jgi:FKBP-type peptidyl-prolyl cis-trans isomerase SlyD
MKVAAGSVITLTYDLCKEDGEIVESSQISGAISFVVGKGAIIKGLDAKLIGLEKGAEQTFEFPPAEAFGMPEDGPTKDIPRSEFPGGDVQVGLKFEAGMGGGQNITLEVLEVSDEAVKVRMIHPLAGQKISMSVGVVGVRDATAAENESGQVVSKPPPPPK